MLKGSFTDPKNWRTVARHPISAAYPDIEGDDWEQIVADAREHGIAPGRKITLHEGQILDGWQQHRLHVEIGVKPEFQPLPEGWDPEDFTRVMNDNRRHESLTIRRQRAALRRERVAQARAEGKSLRTIAEEEEVSESQVRNDLEKAGAHPCAPEPEKVTGKDGKTYSARGKKPLRCERCTRLDINNPDCQACEVTRREAKDKKKPDRQPGEDEDDGLPASVKAALADTWHLDCARALAQMQKQAKKVFNWSVYLDPGVLEALKSAEQFFLSAAPRKLCGECGGAKKIDKQPCLHCKGSGYLASNV